MINAITILQKLISYNTSNPPGNEKECIYYIKGLLDDAGIESRLLCKDENRPNLYARIRGRGESAPIMLYGHLDVVGIKGQEWTIPPFEGIIKDECVWGRGALDMKGSIAIMISAVLKCLEDGITFPGDVILCFLSDEEAEGEFGARYVTEQHPGLFEGIRYAIGEFGGFPFYIGKKKIYLIQVAEKKICRLQLNFKGNGGHGSLIAPNNAIQKMTIFINKLGKKGLPIHMSSITKRIFREMSNSLEFPKNLIFLLLQNRFLAKYVLKRLGKLNDIFYPLLHNIVNPAIINAGDKINVVPSLVEIKMDGRVLPEISNNQFIEEVRQLAGNEVEIKIIQNEEINFPLDYGLFNFLKSILLNMDRDASVIPFLLPGSTDGRFFSKLNIQTFGFIPMDLPKEFNFLNMIHGEDERIPIKCLHFGTEAIYQLLKQF
jgi:acetylornithine deacetylase/succinyl-diaminopimelate desuccinylase-like protein